MKAEQLSNHIRVSQPVAKALRDNMPVVALESTIISHGMPYPDNVQTALMVERIAVDNGAVPATIAIIDGVIRVGLNADEIEMLGSQKNIDKVSRRDITHCIVNKGCGATTVASTMIIANLVGIKVFATGGIGGVHRGGEVSMDISADLQELSHTPVIVVCGGVKSILDIPRTREYLETMGVTVCGYNTDVFPAFYTRDSGLRVDCNVNEYEIAQMFSVSNQLSLHSGLLVAVPIPTRYEIDKQLIAEAIEHANAQVASKRITGKDITPYMLSTIARYTNGASLSTNIHLIKNNCLIASKIAQQVSKLS